MIDTGAAIKRALNGLSQDDAARRMGVTQTTISYWVNGKRQPKLRDVARLLDTTGATWADVFGPAGGADADERWLAGYTAGLADARAAAGAAFDKLAEDTLLPSRDS
jgi:transcriptional regulator with XRE-family HTH domain